MTLNAYSPDRYNGDGATTSFSVTFPFWDADDLQVIFADSDGVETTWTRGTEYTVTGGDGSTGTVEVETSPTDYTPASGEILVIRSNLPNIQDATLPLGGPFLSTTVAQRFDKNVRLIQQRSDDIDRSLKFTITESPDTNRDIPRVALRANKVLAFDASGNAVVSDTTLADIEASVASDGNSGILVVSKTFTGDASTTSFDIGVSVPNKNAILASIDGVLQNPADFSISGTSVVFDQAPPFGAVINIRNFGTAKNVQTAAASAIFYDPVSPWPGDTVGEVLDALLPANAARPFANRAAAVAATVPSVVTSIAYLDWAGRSVPFVEEPTGYSGTAPLTTNSGSRSWIPARKVTYQHWDGDAGDGSTDASTAINGALAWAAANTDKVAAVHALMGTYPCATKVSLQQNVSVFSEPNVTYEFTGTGHFWEYDINPGIVWLDLGLVDLTSNTNAGHDGAYFRKGCSRCDIFIRIRGNGTNTRHGLRMSAFNPDTLAGLNNAYGNRIRIDTQNVSGYSTGAALFMEGQTTGSAKWNSNKIFAGSRLDGFQYSARVFGQANNFDGVTTNKAETAAFLFEGDGTYANTITNWYNDAAIDGDLIHLDHTGTGALRMLRITEPVRALSPSDIVDISSGSETGGALVEQRDELFVTMGSTYWFMKWDGDGDFRVGRGSTTVSQIRVDTSDSVLLNKQTSGLENTGLEVLSAGRTRMTADGDRPLDINRLTNAGDLVRLFQAGGLVGKIGMSGTRMTLEFGSGGIIWRTGSGSPEGSVTAPVGSMYTDSGGGAGTTLWVKESGTGNTGWVAK